MSGDNSSSESTSGAVLDTTRPSRSPEGRQSGMSGEGAGRAVEENG